MLDGIDDLELAELHRQSVKENDPCSMSLVQARVEHFMRQAGQPILSSPGNPGEAIRLLGAKLIHEEAMETINALGVRVIPKGSDKYDYYPCQAAGTFKLAEVVDGCCDTIFVSQWILSSIGVADELPMLEVMDSNDRKFGPGSSKDENGKVRKPSGWVGPDIEGAIAAQIAFASSISEETD